MSKKFYIGIVVCFTAVLIAIQLVTHGRMLDMLHKTWLFAARPIVRVGDFLGNGVRFVGSVFSGVGLQRDLDGARLDIVRLSAELTELNSLREENQKLRQELGLPLRKDARTLTCPVLGQAINTYTQFVTLGCGSNLGVGEGLAVTLNGVLVGTVVDSTTVLSRVRLLSASGSAVDVKVGQQGIISVLRGSFGTGLILDLLPSGTSVKPGEVVVTAGVSGVLAKDIAVGVVGEKISLSADPKPVFVVIPSMIWSDAAYATVVFPGQVE